MSDSKTILFMPESAYGPTNNCIGIGDILRQRGHTVVFAAVASWKGKLEALGFVEDLVELNPPAEGAENHDAGTPFADWFTTLPNAALSTVIEVPYANVRGVEVNPNSARRFGADLAGALSSFLR